VGARGRRCGSLLPVAISWAQALAWRLRRQHLDPIGSEAVEGVVRTLGAVQAGDADAAELAVRTRRRHSEAGEVGAALREGRLIKSFSFRGATHLMTPEDGGVYLALRASGRMWELPSWQSYYNLTPSDWPSLREVVREALAGGPLTIKELVAAIAKPHRFRHLGPILGGNPWSVVKVLAWHGDLAFGSMRGRQATIQRLDGNPRWAGVPPIEEAGFRAVETYLQAYGPATKANLQYWLGNGLGAGKAIAPALARLGDRVVEIELEGTAAMVLREDLDELTSARASEAARLLPSLDQWVLGPGTAERHVVPAAGRGLISRGANVVVVGGVVSGTWSVRDDAVAIEWCGDAERATRDRIDAEVARLAAMLERPLALQA
jgi:hypothetical protein